MGRVKFDRVRLTGFGPYREATTFTFSDQLNVLVAPNETGKSTLVAGVNALLFGLPQTTDEKVFGQARYRNWDYPPAFEGELVFTVDGESYRLRRDFQNNLVSLARKEQGEYREIIAGTHNPRAQRRNLRYEETLKNLLGLSSQELFEATFCLTQPLPEAEELNERVQELLSGTGVGFKRVTAHLVQELRQITRFTGRRGVTTKDAIEARTLEKLAAEMEKIKDGMEQDRDLVDRLEACRRHLEEKKKERTEQAQVLAGRKQLLDLWGEWQQLTKSYEAARVVYSQIRKSKERAEELQAELARIEEEKATYPWGPAVPAQTGELLQQLEAVAEQKATLAREVAELEREAARVEQSEREWARDHGQFTVDWAVLGAEPAVVVEKRRTQASQALASWEEGQDLSKLATENRLLREEEFSLFEQADPAILETIKVYEPRLAFLRSTLENATLKWEQAKAELKQVRSRRRSRWVLVFLTTVLGSVASLFWTIGKAPGLLWPLAGGLLGAGLGCLLGRWLLPGQGLAVLERQVAAAQEQVNKDAQALSGFEQQVKPFATCFPDLTAAYRRWEHLLAEGKELDRKQEEFCRRELGGYSGPAAECPLNAPTVKLNARWAELHAFAQLVAPKEELDCLGALVAWLAAKTPGWWERLLNEAAAFGEKKAELDRLKAQQEANRRYLAKQQQKAVDLTRTVENLRTEIAPLLEAAGDDYQQAGKLWSTWRRLKQEAERTTAALEEILALQKVSTWEELEAKCDDAALKAQSFYRERQQLVAAHPGLAPLEEAADPERIEADYRRRQEEVARGQAELQSIDEEMRSLTMELARLEGQEPLNIAAAEEYLARLQTDYAVLERECDALTLAYQELTAALNDFQSNYRLRLAEITTGYFRELTGSQERRIELDQAFQVAVVIDGRPVTPAQLSYGARDQLFIALRLGIAHFLAAEMVLPFIFDDPFLNCDAGRLAKIRASLALLAKERQIILLSHREDFGLWGEPVTVGKED
ncbi:MAG TPA: AAA family ATPase [Firmicutes bacterium]|jgi:uncharacterized protein YhaN|nr:AAA family ATPase [Bacillota bacterium]